MSRLAATVAVLLLATPPPALQALAPRVMAEVDRLAKAPLWPSFDPRRMSVAIFDGERTWLFRHRHPPAGFVPDETADAFVCPGRLPEVSADTSTPIAGVETATFVMDPSSPSSLRERAALVIHESFHVFQRQRHPGWVANEASLFTYPADDVRALALRREEMAALRRALTADDDEGAAAWAAEAVAFRHARWVKLGNELGSIEVTSRPSLTEGAGDHPLFQGVSRIILTGLDAQPTVTREGDGVRVTAPGVAAKFSHASIAAHDATVTITLTR